MLFSTLALKAFLMKTCVFLCFRNDVSLKERVSYLARAVMCMRSDKVGAAPHLGVFLRELEDLMEVVRVQQQVI